MKLQFVPMILFLSAFSMNQASADCMLSHAGVSARDVREFIAWIESFQTDDGRQSAFVECLSQADQETVGEVFYEVKDRVVTPNWASIHSLSDAEDIVVRAYTTCLALNDDGDSQTEWYDFDGDCDDLANQIAAIDRQIREIQQHLTSVWGTTIGSLAYRYVLLTPGLRNIDFLGSYLGEYSDPASDEVRRRAGCEPFTP